MSMNVTLSHTLMIPNGEVYQITDSKGIVLWKKERKYTISFNANGGSGTMPDQEFTFGELQALPKNVFSKSGSTFYGWSLTPDGMVQYIDGQSIIGIGNGIDTVVLYAVWTTSLNTTYTYTSNQTFVVPITGKYSIEMHGGGGGGGGGAQVSMSAWNDVGASGGTGGGSGATYTTILNQGDSYALTIGKGGSGGSRDTDSGVQLTVEATGGKGGTGGTTKFGNLYSVEGGTGGTGGYAMINDTGHTTTSRNGSSGTAKGNLASGSSGGATTGSYGNGGSGGYGGRYDVYSGSAGQNGAVIIKLIEYSPYTVVFNSNGGTGTMSDQSFNVDETKALSTNTLSKSGYTFLGWATSVDGDVVYADGESVTNIAGSGETITLYAVWEIILEVGQTWTYTSNGTFTVQKTGKYSIEMHGGGGGGGGGAYARNGSEFKTSSKSGGAGGGSGQIYTATLTKGTSHAITIGVGGSGGSSGSRNAFGAASASGESGTTGGTTKFGSLYSLAGGGGGGGGSVSISFSGSISGYNGSSGTASGSLASGSSGGATTGSYGNGGSAGSSSPSSGGAGKNGVVIIKFLGEA